MKRSVECVQKSWIRHNTTNHTHSCHTTYYHTTLCSKQKLLTVVTTRWSRLTHKKRQSRAKKCALLAHIMRSKRVPIIILYYVSDKKAAITPHPLYSVRSYYLFILFYFLLLLWLVILVVIFVLSYS